MSEYAAFTDVPSALALKKLVDQLRDEIEDYLTKNVMGFPVRQETLNFAIALCQNRFPGWEPYEAVHYSDGTIVVSMFPTKPWLELINFTVKIPEEDDLG